MENCKIYKDGFEINGNRYNIGDVIYCDPTHRGIIRFGFYSNPDLDDYGCGYYVIIFAYVNGGWIPDFSSIYGITTYFNEEKETDLFVIRAIRDVSSKIK